MIGGIAPLKGIISQWELRVHLRTYFNMIIRVGKSKPTAAQIFFSLLGSFCGASVDFASPFAGLLPSLLVELDGS